MKVAIYIEPWIKQRAGISVYTEGLAKAAVSSKHTFVTIGSKQMNLPFEHISISSWAVSFFNPFRYVGLNRINLAKYDVDILIDPGHYATLGLFKGALKFVIAHDITPILFPAQHPTRSVLAHKLLMRKSLESCEKIIAVSNQTKEDIVQHYGFNDKICCIYPGVQDFDDSIMLDEPFNISKSPFILTVGTIEPRKNHTRLIEAFDLFCKQDKTVNLVIVGANGWGLNLQEVLDKSVNKDRIHFLGYVPKNELLQLYKSALISVYVSQYEGFGLPVLEAMKLGSPVITSNLGSMKEISGNAALLVDPKSANEIADAMLNLANDKLLREKLKEAGSHRAEEFTWNQFIQKMDEVIENG